MASQALIASRIRDEIKAGLTDIDPMGRWQHIRQAAATAFVLGYRGHNKKDQPDPDDVLRFTGSLQAMIGRTQPDGSPEQIDRIAGAIATAAANASLVAAHPNATKTWRTMRDPLVRDTHVPMEGVTVGALDTFVVGGHHLEYPGQPIGPPEVWINCRCTLAMGKSKEGEMQPGDSVTDALAAAISEEPWSNWSASDYSIEQWHRACLIHEHEGEPTSKSECKLPVRTPTGQLNRNGVHAAAAALAGARGGVKASPPAKGKARRALLGLYRQLGDDPPASLRAAIDDEGVEPPALVAVNTHDAPGWSTNPKETQRLRDYWTKGAGAGKIRWGTDGDFNRCRAQLGKYVGPAYVNGTCANLHYVALGFWPSTHAKMSRRSSGEFFDYDPDFDTEETLAMNAAFAAAADLDVEAADHPSDHSHSFSDGPDHSHSISAPVTAAAPAEDLLPPKEWFQNPMLDGPTPLTVLDDGRVVGHLATWGTCHVGISGSCTEAPHSNHDYAYFRTGETVTAGGRVPVGQITMETGHAGTDLGATAAVAHYDDTGTVVADVAAGEDGYGIWVAGMVRPGVTDAQLRSLRAGALSGDWRRIGGNLELVAALVVNVPGFPIPRTQVASAGGQDIALVAAAVVGIDPNAMDPQRVAIAVMAAMDQREADRQRRARASALSGEITELRLTALAAAVEG